jgi:uncharacterized protein (TIGR03437 family)
MEGDSQSYAEPSQASTLTVCCLDEGLRRPFSHQYVTISKNKRRTMAGNIRWAISVAALALLPPVHANAAGVARRRPVSPPASFAFAAANAPGTLYAAHGPNYTIMVAATGLRFFGQPTSEQLSLRFLGANLNAILEPGARLPGRMNYYLGNDPTQWRTGIELWGSVAIRNIYPGIDVSYHAAISNEPGQPVEYDFHLAPGVDSRQIRVAFDGGVRVRAARDGSLIADGDSASGMVIQKAPVAYQMLSGRRVEVPVRIVSTGRNQISFTLGSYDRRAGVVIDPVLVYSTYLGGSGFDEAFAMTVDGSGNAYVAGPTNSMNFPVKASSSTPSGGYDVFVSKFGPSGDLLFSSLFGGSGLDSANALDLDAAGNILVTGTTDSANFPTYPANAFQTSLGGAVGAAFVLKLDPNGEMLGSTYLGGHTFGPHGNTCPYGSSANGFGIAHDPAGNIYVAGETCVIDFPTLKAFGPRLVGEDACFITEFEPSLLELVYSSYLGGADFDFCNGIAVDSGGNAYLTGATTSSGLATVSAFQVQFGGGVNYGDAFVAKIKSGGTGIAYYTYVGGSGDEAANDIAIDSAGNAYIAGWTQSSMDFPLKNPLQSTYGGGAPGSSLPTCSDCGAGDAFITEINPTGTALVYSTYFGGSGLDVANGIAVDSAGNAYVAGATTSANLEVTAGALESKLPGPQDAFVLEIAPQGTALKYSSYLGGSNDDAAWKIAATDGGNVYVTGSTQSSNFPTVQAILSSLQGMENAFLTEIDLAAPSIGISAVTNGASFSNAPAVSPGSLVTIFAATGVSQPASASSIPLPVILGDLSVTVNGIAVPMIFVNSTQVNFQLPNEILPGPATVALESGSGSSEPFPFTVSAAAPGIFTYGSNQVVAQNYPSLSVNAPNKPATAGGVVIVYLTGIGPLNNVVADGLLTPSSPLSTATSSHSATINQVNAPISFLGLTPGFVGLAQANLTVPAELKAGTYPLVITVDGMSSNAAMITVK